MGIFHPSCCPQCGAPVKLRSFRPPPSKCGECGAWLDPQEATERTVSWVFLPTVFLVSFVVGYLCFRLGGWLAPPWGFRLGFLLGADSLGFGVFLYWRVVGGPKAESLLRPTYGFAVFAVMGVKFSLGLGPAAVFVWTMGNGIVGAVVILILVRRDEWSSLSVSQDAAAPIRDDQRK